MTSRFALLTEQDIEKTRTHKIQKGFFFTLNV